MDSTIFKKLKAKPGMTAMLLYPPEEYPKYEDFTDVKESNNDFVHLFARSIATLEEHFEEATSAVADNGLLWVSYPKPSNRQIYDVNHEILWHMAIARGWHSVSQVSLGKTWTAVLLKRNDPGVVYEMNLRYI